VTRTVRLAAALAAAAGLCLCGPGAALAQPVEPTRETSTPLYGKITPEEYTARALARIATLDLRFVTDVGPRDYTIAAALFGLAEELVPDDEGIVRRRYEAAMAAGDGELAMELTRKLALLDPGDQMAVLRVISGKIGQLQTIEARMDLYNRLLGPAGQELPEPIRAQLALDQALLLREQGDVDGFAERLALTISLDPTNKDAAFLAAQYYTDLVGDATGQIQLLVNLLYADPLDPNIHESLARLLASQGAWEQAKRFHDNGLTLLSRTQELSDQLYLEKQLLVWRTQGPQVVVDSLNALLEVVRMNARRKLASDYAQAVQEANARGQQPPAQPQIDLSKVTMPLPYERLRLQAALAAGDPATLEQAAANIELLMVQVAEQARRNAPDEATGARSAAMAMLDLQTMRLWADIQGEKSREFAATYTLPRAELPQEVMAQTVAGAFQSLRNGDARSAITALLPVPDEVFLKHVGLAIAHEQAGELEAAVERLKRLAAEPLSIPGAWAATRLERLRVSESEVYPRATQVAALVAGISKGLDRMISDPRAYMSLVVEPVSANPGPLGQLGYKVTVKNTSPIPLSVGGDRVINTRLLFSPKMEADLDKVTTSAVPEVIEVDRRLRLEPGESFSAVVYPEYGWAGYSLEAAVSRTTKVRWRILQGFTMAQGGMYEAGPTSLTTETPVVIRRPLPETTLPVAALCDKLRVDAEASLPYTIAAMRSLLTGPQRPDRTMLLSEAEVSMIAQAAAERYPTLSVTGRKMLLVGLPSGTMPMMGLLRAFDNSCRNEADPGVMSIFLATRVNDHNDPTLTAAGLSADPRLGPLARLLAERLATGTNTFARLPVTQPTGATPQAGQGGNPQGGGQPPAGGGSAPGGR
jgi:hypothetical protein